MLGKFAKQTHFLSFVDGGGKKGNNTKITKKNPDCLSVVDVRDVDKCDNICHFCKLLLFDSAAISSPKINTISSFGKERENDTLII